MSWGRYHVTNILLKSSLLLRKHIYIFKKTTKITPFLINKWVYIYNGKRFFRRYIYAKYVGYLAGELIWTRKPAIFKKKKKKKRSKKTLRKQTKNVLRRRRKLLFKIRRRRIKRLKKEKLQLLNPLLKPRKASQKFIPDTVARILKFF